jgi:hypothetical protein
VALGDPDPNLLPAFRAHGSALGADFVSGVLFNGQPFAEDYTVTAFSGFTQVASQLFTAVPSDLNGGFENFSIDLRGSGAFNRVSITTPNAGTNGWDFFVDTITLGIIVPEPPSIVMDAISGLIGLGYWWRRRKRAVA